MATYLQGVTDFVPEIQPFQPDFNFYANYLQTKQNQYDSNYKNLSNLYGELYHGAVTRDDSSKMKDENLKKIDFELKRVSGLDLSLEQNVEQAKQVFKPFYENKHLMKDMALTKNYNNTLSRTYAMKNSKDEKERARYWDTGVKSMQYRLDEFKNAASSEVLNFGSIQYTPYSNAAKKYMDMAKEYNLSVDITQADKSGMYFVRQKNGELILPSLQKMFLNAYVNDPELQSVYATQAYVNRKDEVKARATKFGNNEVAAEKDYLQEQFKNLRGYVSTKAQHAEEAYTVTNNKINDVQTAQQRGDVHPKQSSYLNRLNQTLTIEDHVRNHSAKLNEDLNGASSTASTQGLSATEGGLDLEDMELARNKVDAGYANLLAERDIMSSAQIYANKDRIYDIKVNPVGLEGMRNANNMRRDAANNAFAWKRDMMKYQYDIAKTKSSQEFDEKLADKKIIADRDNLINKHNLEIGVAKVDKDGNIVMIPNLQYKAPIKPDNTGNLTVNQLKVNRNELMRFVDEGAAGYTDNFFNLISNGIEGEKSIDRTELAQILGTTPDKALKKFYTIKKQYQDDPTETTRRLTTSGDLFKYKKALDKWAYGNDANTSVAKNYLNDSQNQIDVEQVKRYYSSAVKARQENEVTITAQLERALGPSNYKEQTKKELVNLYKNKYLTGKISKDDFNDLAKRYIIDKYEKEPVKTTRTTSDRLAEKTYASPSIGGMTSNTAVLPSSNSSYSGDIFNDLHKAYQTTVTNPKLTKSVYPNVMSGKGGPSGFAVQPTYMDVNLAHKGGDGYTYFAQTVNDINGINFNQDKNSYGISLGVGKDGKEMKLDMSNDNDYEKAKKYKRLVNDLLNLSFNADQAKKPTVFKLEQAQIAGENEKAGSMTIHFPRKFLEEQIKDGDYKIDAKEVEQIYQNGIKFMAPQSQWKNQMFKSNQLTPTEAILNMNKKIDYTSPNNAGNYLIEKDKNSGNYRYSVTYNTVDGEGNLKAFNENDAAVTFGKNIDAFERDFFTKFQMVTERNLGLYKKFHTEGNTEAMKKMESAFGFTPKQAGFND